MQSKRKLIRCPSEEDKKNTPAPGKVDESGRKHENSRKKAIRMDLQLGLLGPRSANPTQLRLCSESAHTHTHAHAHSPIKTQI